MASGNVLGVVLRHAFISAFIVTLYEVGSDVLGTPGSRLGTITRRDKHLGLSQLETTVRDYYLATALGNKLAGTVNHSTTANCIVSNTGPKQEG